MEGKFLWVFCAVVAVTSARTISKEDGENLTFPEEEASKVEPHIFENKIVEAINKLKEFLKKGDPSSGIPPLDPYFLSHQAFDFYILDTKLKGFFQNTTFANYSNFLPQNVEFKLMPLHFKLDLFLDHLRIDGRYRLLGKILDIPVNGTGKFVSDTKNLTISLYMRPTTVNSSLQIKDLIIDFNTKSEKINYTNELVDDKIHVLDENLALYILDQAQAKYSPPLLDMVKSVLNHFLLGYTFDEIMKMILDFLSKY